MGGNTKAINRDTGEVIALAQKIDLSQIDRKVFTVEVRKLLYSLNQEYFKKTSEFLWSENLISDSSLFSGTTKYLFDANIPDEEFIKYKPTVGDLDIMVERTKLPELFEFLALIELYSITKNISYIGQNRKVCNNTQINALFKYQDNIYFQIDFEGIDFENNRPNDFAYFSHSADWTDIKLGYKGVSHKLLLRNITKAISLNSNMTILTPASSEDPKDKKFRIKKADGILRMLTFSVDRGLREKYRQVIDKKVDLPLKIGMNYVYKELPTSESIYIVDIPKIFEILFKIPPTKEDLKLFRTFIGLVDLMKKYLQVKAVTTVYDFLIEDSLFGDNVQQISRDNWKEDYDVKVKIIQKLWLEFPFLQKFKEDTLKKMRNFYKNYGK